MGNNFIRLPLTRSIWERAWHAPEGISLRSICAKIACVVFPIILGIALVELIMRTISNASLGHSLPQHISPVRGVAAIHPVAVRRIALDRESNQYQIDWSESDPYNERPPACSFHALQAISTIGSNFTIWVEKIEAENRAELSDMQKRIIKQGLQLYQQTVAIDASFRAGADFENIRSRCPQFLSRVNFEPINQDTYPVPQRTRTIADRLFSSPRQTQVAFIKSGNEESFAVICHNNLAIIFDSHHSEIACVRGKDPLQRFLTDKLTPHSQLIDGIDAVPFAYAIGRL